MQVGKGAVIGLIDDIAIFIFQGVIQGDDLVLLNLHEAILDPLGLQVKNSDLPYRKVSENEISGQIPDSGAAV